MKNQSFIKSRIASIILIVVLGISFAFPPNGVNSVQAKSISGETQKTSATIVEAQLHQDGGDGGVTLQQPKSKKHQEKLIDLINASGMSDVIGDTSNLGKMDSHLLELVSASISGADVIQTAQNSDVKITDNRSVLLDIYVNGALDQAVTQLEELGMQVMATNDSFGGVVEGYLPVNSLMPAAKLGLTKAFIPVVAYGVDTGSVTSQGDAAHNGPAARAMGTNGSGVVVGVISDSINRVGGGVAGSQTLGDLPASVTVLADGPSGSSDEGPAMAQIIYDTVPGITNMYFSSGTASGAAGKASSINNLVSHGVDIIADDIYYIDEPFFQDGMISQAVDNAYKAGVAYFASAGNRARQSYESSYRNDGYGYGFHNFNTSGSVDDLQTIRTVPPGGVVYIVLQWDDPWGAATHDFDIHLWNMADLSSPLAVAEDSNIVTGLPIEYLYWYNDTGTSVTVADSILLWAGPNNGFLKYICLTSAISEYNTASDAINPDAASAKGSMAVAAVNWGDSGLNDPESYSSRGPKTRFFNASGVRLAAPEVRQKPNVAGADCVATSFGFGGGSFCGTSAATPSVAGVAALVLADRPTLTPFALYKVLKNPASTIDCTAAGNPDTDCGSGFVLANNAVTYERSMNFYGAASKWTSAFDLSHGWTVSNYVRTVGDVSGDGKDDIVGFGADGVYVATSTGTGFNAASKWTSAFDLSHGWTVSQYVRTVGDVNGDGKADIVGFGADGVYVATSTGTGFNAASKWTSAFDLAHGWTVSQYVRTVGDVNGDGMADLIGFGANGVYVALSTGSGFNTVSKWTSAFDLAHGWTVSQYVRTVGDVNNDGRDDLIGFGLDGVYVATSTGSGFNTVSKWTSAFDLSHGWTVAQYVRTVGDVNADGRVDLVGFGANGVYVATSTGSGFNTVSQWTDAFDLSHGWTVADYVRTVGDVSGDGKADIVGFGSNGVYVATVK